MLQLLRGPRPLLATLAIASIANIVLGLVASAGMRLFSALDLFLHAYLFLFIMTYLLRTTDFAAKGSAYFAGAVYLLTLFVSDFAIYLTAVSQDGPYPLNGRLIVASTVCLVYAVACIVGVGAVWRSFPNKPFGAIAIVAIPVAVAMFFVMFVCYANVACATMRDCL